MDQCLSEYRKRRCTIHPTQTRCLCELIGCTRRASGPERSTMKVPDVISCSYNHSTISHFASCLSFPSRLIYRNNACRKHDVCLLDAGQIPPIFKLMLVSPGKPDCPLTTNMMIHLASTPTKSVRMDYDS
jgi:hypothetical protein